MNGSHQSRSELNEPGAERGWPTGGPLLQFVQIVIAVSFATYLAGTIVEPSFYFDLTVGNWIVAHRTVPTTDLWTTIGAGHAWLDSSWLHQAAIAVLYAAYGETGPYSYKVVLYTLIYLASAHFFSIVASSKFVGHLFAAIFCAAALASGPFGSEVTALALIVCYLAICSDPVSLRWYHIAALAALLVIHANTHPSALVGAVLVTILIGSQTASLSKRMLLLLLIAVTQIMTPYLGGQIPVAITWGSSELAIAAAERANAATVFDFGFSFSVLLGAILVIFAVNGGRLRGSEIMISALFVLLMLVDRTYAPYALLMLVTDVAAIWGRSREVRSSELGIGISKLESAFSKLPMSGTLFLLLCMSIVNVAQTLRDPINDVGLPVEEAELLLNQPSISEVYAAPDIAPYVIYVLSDLDGIPIKRVTADGRIRLFNAELASSFQNVESLTGDWSKLLTQTKPEAFLVRARSALAAICSPPRFEEIPSAQISPGGQEAELARTIPAWKICDKWSLLARSDKEEAS